jgi:hypothetical protein
MARINPVYVAALSNPVPVPKASSTGGNFFTNAAKDAKNDFESFVQEARDRAQNLRPIDLPEANESGVMGGRAVYSGGGNVGGVIGGEDKRSSYNPYRTESERFPAEEAEEEQQRRFNALDPFSLGRLLDKKITGGRITQLYDNLGETKVGKGVRKFRDGVIGFGKSIGSIFSDRKLKTNIKLIGKSEQGYNIYSFKFIDPSYGEGIYQGVIADEMPEQVVSKNEDGYYMVDYSMIDVEFKKIDEYSRVTKTNNKNMGKIIAKSGVELNTSARCRPSNKRVMTSRDMTIKSDLSVDNIMYKGNANLLAQR